MRDYRFSEIKKACEESCGDCRICNVQNFCQNLIVNGFPKQVDVAPRDMIDLPYKFIGDNGDPWLVYRRKNGSVNAVSFETQREEEEFIEKLKGERNV